MAVRDGADRHAEPADLERVDRRSHSAIRRYLKNSTRVTQSTGREIIALMRNGSRWLR